MDTTGQPGPSRRRGTERHTRRGVPASLSDATRGVRLQKVLAEAGVGSRRYCEDLIVAGQVRVNGDLVTALPAWVDPDQDRISIDGKPMRRTSRGIRFPHKIYVILNKPRRVISTTKDPQGRRQVTDMIDLPEAPRLFPVGRLDADTTGLILMTNDGELAQLLAHPRNEVTKEYQVSIKGRLNDEDVETLKRGLFLAGRKRKPTQANTLAKRTAMQQVRRLDYSRGKTGNERTRLSITLNEGQNREIRRLMAKLGFSVRRLERVALGPLKLKGLAPGQWRMLTQQELKQLKGLARGQTAQDKPTRPQTRNQPRNQPRSSPPTSTRRGTR